MDVTSELISRYADGHATPEEAVLVEEAVARDPVLAAELEDFRLVAGLFGDLEPEEVSKGLEARLYALDTPAPAAGFELLRRAPVPPRISWQTKAAAIAAVVLLAIGVLKLTRRPDVVLAELARFSVGPGGVLTDIQRVSPATLRAGTTLRAGENERLSIRTREGDRVTLLPGGAIAIGDPLDGEVFELERGTTLCSILTHDRPRTVQAGPYKIRVAHEAHFGVRISEPDVRPAGAARSETEVTVTVSLGAVEVVEDGTRETLSACQRAIFSPKGETRTHAAADPVYFELMRSFREYSREIIPGYFTGEPGVSPIAQRWVPEPDGGVVLVVSDADQVALEATHMVLKVKSTVPGHLQVTRIRPLAGRPGDAETSTVTLSDVGQEWTVVDVPRADFDGPTARKAVKRVGADRSQLVRFEARVDAPRARVEVSASVWAARPPVELGR